FAEGARGLLKNLRFDEAENFRRVRESRRTESLGMPPLDDDDGALDEWQIRRGQDKRQLGFALLRMRVEHEEVNVVILAFTLRDVFAVLADQELVQLEVFADNGFADGSHGIYDLRLASASSVWCNLSSGTRCPQTTLPIFRASTNLTS